jgi:threonine/homoserine/homoserine lactone efflux protein
MIADDVFSTFIFSLLVSFAAVISPGPLTAAILSEAPRSGWQSGLFIAAGHSVLELLILIMICLGLSTAMQNHHVLMMISFGGSLILFWIGANYINAGWKDVYQLPNSNQAEPSKSSKALIGLGMVTTLSNPFWYIWWISIAAGYLIQARAISTLAIAAFYIGHISADFAWDTALAAATSTGRRWLGQQGYRGLMLGTGGFMTYLGVRYFINALEII